MNSDLPRRVTGNNALGVHRQSKFPDFIGKGNIAKRLSRGVPDGESAASTTTSNKALGITFGREHRSNFAIPLRDLRSVVHIPPPQRAVLPSREQSIGVRRPTQGVNGANVSAQRVELLSRRRFPNL